MTDQPGRGEHAPSGSRRHGEHEPGPGTVPAAELLAELRASERAAGDDDSPHTPDAAGEVGDDDAGHVDAGHGDAANRASTPPPVLVAAGLGLHTRHGWVFRDVDLELAPGTVTTIVGPAGSGRTSLLLALTGRMRVTDGTLTIAGRSATADPRAARNRSAVARIADLIGPEERLTVRESVTERCLIDGVHPTRGANAFRRACEQIAVTFDDAVLVEELAPQQRTILALALAAIRPADAIVLDDTDLGVTADGEREIYRAAARLAESGPAIVTTTTRHEAVGDGAVAVPIAGSPDGPVTAGKQSDPPSTTKPPPDTLATATTEDER